MPVVGQVAVVSTVVFSSMTSTAMLQVVAHPYVYALYEGPKAETDKERYLVAEKVDFLGRVRPYGFKLSQVENSSHPFASFQVKNNGGNFYVFGNSLDDPELRSKLTKEK